MLTFTILIVTSSIKVEQSKGNKMIKTATVEFKKTGYGRRLNEKATKRSA